MILDTNPHLHFSMAIHLHFSMALDTCWRMYWRQPGFGLMLSAAASGGPRPRTGAAPGGAPTVARSRSETGTGPRHHQPDTAAQRSIRNTLGLKTARTVFDN
jgi:hypothetical protein